MDPNVSWTIKKYSEFFNSIQSSYSHKKKQDYINKYNLFYNTIYFTWRLDQQRIINSIVKNEHKYYVINGIFGCGKTTMLFGVLINFIVQRQYKPSEVMFVTFNVCIKNEIKRKLKPYGFKGKVKVSTFDSIIYSICKRLGYKYLDLPNFDGKRRFCYEHFLAKTGLPEEVQPKVIFIDEVQDLERNCLDLFKYYFPSSKIIFAGDVFQSIQKEPRESLLWSLLSNNTDSVQKYYMDITPRVPRNILLSLQETLSNYYPEFSNKIKNWNSENTDSNVDIQWDRIYSYSQMFEQCSQKIDEFGETNTMVLTFSSAITVKGALGDVARFRMNLSRKYNVNKNHKKIETDKLFLSTANSSKGLERDHVLVFLTFPLERAFSCFSDDIVVNLITVAITRAKKSVHFFIPAYKDKFTKVLTYFKGCPSPNKEKLRVGKMINEFKFQDYMDMDKCVTELIRQNVILYDTRLELKENVKRYNKETCFDGDITVKRPIMICEEEKAMVGVIIENLITSTWGQYWPGVSDIERLRTHPLYCHIFRRIESSYNRYNNYIKNTNINNTEEQFRGIYLFSQLQLAMYNKLFITFPQEAIDRLKTYWYALKPKVIEFKPGNKKLNIQSNLQMPWITGVADAIFTHKVGDNNEYEECNIWEIKASISPGWKDDALTQALLYSLMTGKIWSLITLINPFRNEKVSFHFNSRKIMTLRDMVYKDTLCWNLNCYLAKTYNTRNPLILDTNNCYFAHLNYIYKECCICLEQKKMTSIDPCHHQCCFECLEKLKECPLCRDRIKGLIRSTPVQLTIIDILSPTKVHVRLNKYFKTVLPPGKTASYNKLEKLSKESTEVYNDDWISKQNKKIWLTGDIKNRCHDVKELIEIDDFATHFEYAKNPDFSFSLNFEDGLIRCICTIAALSDKYKFL